MLNHYVAQFHLKKFYNDHNNFFVYEKNGNKKTFKTNSKNIAAENNLISDDLEKSISDFEGKTSSVFNKIINHESLSICDKETMAKYMLLSYLRIPSEKRHALNFVKQNEPKARQIIEQCINSIALNHPNGQEFVLEGKEYLSQVEKNGLSQPERVWYETIHKLDFPLSNDMILNTMKWHLIYSDDEDVFAMNDNPFCLTPPIGLKTRRKEILFPISKRMILWLNWSLYKNEYIQASELFIKEANKRIVNTATKYIFFPTDEGWLYKMVNENKLDYKQVKFSGELVKNPAQIKAYELEIQRALQQARHLKNHRADPIEKANENLKKLFLTHLARQPKLP